MVKPLRDMIPLSKYQRTGKLIWTTESSASYLELSGTLLPATPILQIDVSDYGIGGYLCMVINGKVRVIRFFSNETGLPAR